MTTNSGFWEDGLEGTADRLNASLLQRDTLANRPTAGQEGRLFVASDGNNAGLMYRDSGTAWVQVLLSDQATSVASLRTLGTGAAQAAAGDHTHTIAVDATALDDNSGTGVGTSETDVASVAMTTQSGTPRAWIVYGYFYLDTNNTNTYTARLKIGATTLQTRTGLSGYAVSDNWMLAAISAVDASTAYTIKVTAQANSGSSLTVGGGVGAKEISD
tara:strand:- start:174 stop:821 length:648 start_codon:yes stop_codon:yes gene_type:complete